MASNEMLNAYYTGISGWQKAVRRGDEETALRMLRVLLKVCDSKGLQGFYRRIYVCLYEDIDRGDVPALRAIGKRLDEKPPKAIYNSSKDLVWLTKRMAAATKCGDGAAAFSRMKAAAGKLPGDAFEFRRMRDARDLCDPLGFAAAGWRLYLQDHDKFWEKLAALTPSARRDLVRLAQRAWSRGSEYAWSSAALLPFDAGRDPISDKPEKTVFHKGFPGYALDVHTSLGKKSIGIVAKKLEMDQTDVSEAVWYCEGRLLSPAVYNKAARWRRPVTAKHRADWKQIKPLLEAVREWVMKKFYRGPEA
jgi:hypothetical protein